MNGKPAGVPCQLETAALFVTPVFNNKQRKGAGMMTWSQNRLLVVGPKAALDRFKASDWQDTIHARHSELLETSVNRFACQFETDTPPLTALQNLSSRCPDLVLVLDYEIERSRIKGLAKAKAGQLAQLQLSY